MSHLDELERYSILLADAYRSARDELRREIERNPAQVPGTQPEHMRDASGRFILLDALTAIVQAKATIAQIKEGRENDDRGN